MSRFRLVNRCWHSAQKAAWIFMVFFSVACFSLQAARVEVMFKNDQTTHKSNEIASNMLKVVNGSDKKLNFYLGLNVPAGWSSTKSGDLLYQLEAGDSLFIPLKLMFKGREEGNMNNLITASLLSASNRVQFASANWYLQVESVSNWVANTDKKEAFFINNSDTTDFNLSVHNTGNATEWFSVKLSTNLRLLTYFRLKMEEVPALFNFSLPPGTDTLFQFVVKTKEVRESSYQNQNSRGQNNHAGESYPLKVQVQTQHKDKSPDKTWKTTIDFKRQTNEVQFNAYSRMVLPLTVEMRMDNLMESATTLNLNLYGTALLEHSRSLTYRMQSIFSDQYLNERSYKGNYHYLSYTSPRSLVELGNISGWGNFGQTPSGIGAKGEYVIRANRIGVMYIQNPVLFQNPSVKTIGIRDVLTLKTFSIVNYYEQSWNQLSKVDGKLFITGADFRIRQQHIFTARIGSSIEHYFGAQNPFNKSGVGGSFNYSGTVKNFNLRFSSNYGSDYYSGFRGLLNLNYGLTYKQNSKYTWDFLNSIYNQHPVYLDQFGNIYSSFDSKGQHFDLRLTSNNRTGSHSFRAAYYDDDQIDIHYLTRGLGFDYRPVSKSSVRFLATVFASYIKQPETDIPDYFTSQIRTSFRYKSFTTNVRYNYGPFQAYEHKRFAEHRTNYQSVFINSYYGFWLWQHMLSLEPSLNYSYETLYKKGRLSIRPELFYFSKSGWQLSTYAQFLTSSQKLSTRNEFNNSENIQQSATYTDLQVGVALKKEIGIPFPGKRYYTARVIAFKDLNGNMKQDKNEEVIENILVNIKPVSTDSSSDDMRFLKERGEDVVTDAKGLVTLRNLPAGIYMISSRSLVQSEGWFTSGDQILSLDKSKEILIPFARGVNILGSITVDHNLTMSSRKQDPELSRIRVTAVDSAGRTYSCLTSINGSFELYVPTGDYRVSINQNAIDDDFTLDQNLVLLNLNGNIDAYRISFIIREKERLIKVKKFNSDGTLQQENK